MEGKARAQAFDFGRCQTSGQDLAPKGVRKKMLQGCMLYQLRKSDALESIFAGDLSPQLIIEQLSIYHGKLINPETTLIIFDEIQEMPRALTSLKYFCEEAPEYAICCAGSLLGIALHEGTSFPVGKTNFLHLYPCLSRSSFLQMMSRCWSIILRKETET